MTTSISEDTRKIPSTPRRSRALPVLFGFLVLALAVIGIWWFAIRDNSEVLPVAVTGTETCSPLPDKGGFSWYRCIDTTSDARVNGTARVSVLPPVDFDAMEGTVELTNDGGTWHGPWKTGGRGVGDDRVTDDVLEGTGDYVGLQYRARWESIGLGEYSVTGTIEAMS
jgi:hypothetical protein